MPESAGHPNPPTDQDALALDAVQGDLKRFIEYCVGRGKRVWFTNRSQIIAHQRCPRFRWWTYHYSGRGIVKKKLDVPLSTGGFTHMGLALLLSGRSADEAVGIVNDAYMAEVSARELDLERSEQQAMVAAEQMALCEAFLRLAALRVIPELLTEYEIVDVEREEWYVLYEDDRNVIVVETRPDALLRERATSMQDVTQNSITQIDGDLYLLSWKTKGNKWDSRAAREAKVDMQGLSESYPVELRMNQPVMGIKMVHLLKGSREEDEWNPGTWLQRSPLIRAFLNATGPTPEWAWAFNWKDPFKVNERTGKPVSHRLPKGYRLVFIPDHMPIKEWIDMLNAGTVQPDAGDCLQRQYISPMPELRSDAQKQELLHEIAAQESRIIRSLDAVSSASAIESDLSTEFPKYRHSCNYPKKCPCWDLCHGAEYPEEEGVSDPLTLYQIRTPHHPGEDLRLGEE